jgi:hypothetical protein
MELLVAVTNHVTRYVVRSRDVDFISQGETVDGEVENRAESPGGHFDVEWALDSLEHSLMTTDLIRVSSACPLFPVRNSSRHMRKVASNE